MRNRKRYGSSWANVCVVWKDITIEQSYSLMSTNTLGLVLCWIIGVMKSILLLTTSVRTSCGSWKKASSDVLESLFVTRSDLNTRRTDWRSLQRRNLHRLRNSKCSGKNVQHRCSIDGIAVPSRDHTDRIVHVSSRHSRWKRLCQLLDEEDVHKLNETPNDYLWKHLWRPVLYICRDGTKRRNNGQPSRSINDRLLLVRRVCDRLSSDRLRLLFYSRRESRRGLCRFWS